MGILSPFAFYGSRISPGMCIQFVHPIDQEDKEMEYGYARVSTREQNEERQFIALREYGLTDSRITLDKQSGKDFERSGYKRLLRKLKSGDTLVIKSIDRLGRNYEEILEQWRIITKEKDVDIVVLDMPLLDTRRNRDLTGTLIADIVLQLLSYVAQTEREFIRQRQAEGIAAAKARGVRFGRPNMERPPGFADVKSRWERGELSAREAGRLLHITHRTFLLWVQNEDRQEAIEK
jgi:DNA invertase Pin-like site-specific DNA recombinase